LIPLSGTRRTSNVASPSVSRRRLVIIGSPSFSARRDGLLERGRCRQLVKSLTTCGRVGHGRSVPTDRAMLQPVCERLGWTAPLSDRAIGHPGASASGCARPRNKCARRSRVTATSSLALHSSAMPITRAGQEDSPSDCFGVIRYGPRRFCAEAWRGGPIDVFPLAASGRRPLASHRIGLVVVCFP